MNNFSCMWHMRRKITVYLTNKNYMFAIIWKKKLVASSGTENVTKNVWSWAHGVTKSKYLWLSFVLLKKEKT